MGVTLEKSSTLIDTHFEIPRSKTDPKSALGDNFAKQTLCKRFRCSPVIIELGARRVTKKKNRAIKNGKKQMIDEFFLVQRAYTRETV